MRLRFHTGLYDYKVAADVDFAGRGFAIRFRHTATRARIKRGLGPGGGALVMGADGKTRLQRPFEALIMTVPGRAQRVANLLHAAWAVVDGGLTLLSDIEPFRDPPEIAGEAVVRRYMYTSGTIAFASAIAAAVSHRKALAVATCRLTASYRAMSVHHMDLEPGPEHIFRVERDPVAWVTLAQAATTAFSAIEDLNLKVHTFNKKPAKTAGAWEPVALDSLEKRLRTWGIDPSAELLWLSRGTPTRLEREGASPTGTPATWAGGMNRDRMVKVTDALYYAQFIRNRAAAHGYSDMTKSLTVTEVSNLQRLVRELILRSTPHWDVVTGKRPLQTPC